MVNNMYSLVLNTANILSTVNAESIEPCTSHWLNRVFLVTNKIQGINTYIHTLFSIFKCIVAMILPALCVFKENEVKSTCCAERLAVRRRFLNNLKQAAQYYLWELQWYLDITRHCPTGHSYFYLGKPNLLIRSLHPPHMF